MTEWETRVHRHLRSRGIDLGDTVVEEVAAHLEDAWEARPPGAPADPEAFAELLLARADIPALPRRPRAVAPPAPETGRGVFVGLGRELRHVLRGLRRAPIFTAAVVLVLGLGIGTTTAAFRIVYAAFLAPLPYATPDRLVMVWERNVPRNRPRNVVNPGNFFVWSEQAASLDAAGLFTPTVANLAGRDLTPEELPAMAVQGSVLAITGVRPLSGRLLVADDEQPAAAPAILISAGLWRRRFGAADDTIGRAVTINGGPATVVGILPADFHIAGFHGDVWRPLPIAATDRTNFRGRSLLALARLKPGVTPASAQAELSGIFRTLEADHPDFNTGWTTNVVPVRDQMAATTRPALLALFASIAAVLAVACANVAALLLVRASARAHELAVRATLGASPWQLVRQVALECAALVACGTAVGVVTAVAITRGVWTTAHDAGIVVAERGGLDVAALIFATGLAGLTMVACSVGPVRRAFRSFADVRQGGRGVAGTARMRGVLVAAEVAAATLVLTGAGMLARSYVALQQVDPGFTVDRVLTARVSRMGPDSQKTSAGFGRDVLARLRALPGVTHAAATSFLPLDGRLGIGSSFRLADRPAPAAGASPVADYRPITPEYFATLGIALREGRDFSESDVEGRPRVAIVNETFVRQLSADVPAIGRRLDDSLGESQEIVGVVDDIALDSLGGQARPTIYLPHAQLPIGALTFVVRTAQDPASLGRAVAAAIRDVDPAQPVSDIRPLDDVVRASLTRPRIASATLGLFAAAALLLAAIGVYGVVAYGVQLRRAEFGVRLALGARPADIVRLVVAQSMWLIAGGALVGAVLSVPLSSGLRALLFGVAPGDPWTLAAVGAVVVAAGFLASYVPARRGSSVDPTTALRAE